ncbi:cysteine hydrolase family protein [Actinoallomurus soli]|uniref:cysteine hydrolase family protein n=1 Tax=Actinoallomurus soli TaxID=2952535 RepID=UPI0020934295|nr:isochorismatase family cysteine hydrolase [Actinoallomurus soli]MCO5970924.1 cysteine hydrolase [Actinoallomurus soli]
MTENTALLVMDVQQGIVSRVSDPAYLPRVVRAIDAARAAGIPVMHVVIGFRSGHPETTERNKAFGALPAGAFTPEDPGAAVHPDIEPRPEDIVITKKRVSAFAGSDLEMVLRARGIEHLVLAGIATSGVVLSTLRQAADLDYRLTVLADGCLDGDPEVHRVLTEKVFPRQADVVSVEEWVSALA